jgi:hypothetical protein
LLDSLIKHIKREARIKPELEAKNQLFRTSEEASMRSLWPFLDLCTPYLSVADYLNARTLSTTADLYRYWKEADSLRDLLKPLVLKYHSAPLGSLKSEHLWSTTSQTLTPLRKQLMGEKLK